MRKQFDRELRDLEEEVTAMGEDCEKALAIAARAARTGVLEEPEEVDHLEQRINNLEDRIQNDCVRLILEQQPVASDLKMITASSHIITDLERIGDYAQDISDMVHTSGGHAYTESEKVLQMSGKAAAMVTEAVDAFVRGDTELAVKVIQGDDQVDRLFNETRKEIASFVAKDPENSGWYLDLYLMAKYYERIADHAVNVAEWVQFRVTGVHTSLDEPVDDERED